MTHDASSLAKHFGPLLVRREAELRAALETVQHRELADEQATSGEVQDFKDMAYREVQADMAALDADRTAAELAQALAARRRLQDGSFGCCEQCGQDIDLRRLEALPATPLCVTCQAASESTLATREPHAQ
ncbi:TraR/DksA C4-type zinc finger protein [Polaromonas sp. YR568]|uniref:TraR/DksA family transcriptional regulator n=1 Tax=Polaromonas sp. YR568 TaxID=1855301 RepID=UPI0031382ECC